VKTHDPFCVRNLALMFDSDVCPFCKKIAAARADERERAAQRVSALPIESDSWSTYYEGYADALNLAEQAARGEES